MRVLVTGGAGYIGSHTCLALLQGGHEVVALDNLCNSDARALERVQQIAGKPLTFYEADIRDAEALGRIFAAERVEAVIHFAALKAVAESVRKPLEYFQNNLTGTLTLLAAMREAGVFRFVFSSSATVYGERDEKPIREDSELKPPQNPYGRTKVMIEQMLGDLWAADERWSICLLRYFNPVGAHESGLIGEDPRGVPANLMPLITRVMLHPGEVLNVCGTDYPTPDGTCIRDYIHVMDLAQGHILALECKAGERGVFGYNLGTGTGSSVWEVIHAFERANGLRVPVRVAPRRPGDVPFLCAATDKAREELGFQARRGLEEMCRDAWHWQRLNPEGYRETAASVDRG